MKKTIALSLSMVLVLCGVSAVMVWADDAPMGTKVFDEKGFGYAIQYPDNWLYYTQQAHTAVFIGKGPGDRSLPTVMIKSLFSDKAGGTFKDVDSVIADLEKQLRAAEQAIVFNPEPFVYARDGLNLKGKQVVTEYTLKDEKFKEWALVLPRLNGEAFFVWAYTAPRKAYDEYLPVAKAMFHSWVIKD